DLYRDSATRSIGSAFIRSMSPEHTVLALCANGAKEGWRRMKVLCDLAQRSRNHPELDWERVLWDAQRSERLPILLLGIGLSSRLLEWPMPQIAETAIAREPRVIKLVEHFTHRAPSGCTGPVPGLEAHRDYLRIWSSWSDRRSYIWYALA